MKIAARRRLAVGVLATTTALLAGFLVAPAANAANITSINPNFAVNNDDSETLTFTTQSPFPPSTAEPFLGAGGVFVTLSRVGADADSLESESEPTTNPNQVRATFDFKDSNGGSRAADGPSNPGLYNARIEDTRTGNVDTCQGCFTVINSLPLTVSSTTPTGLAQGGAENITVKGSGFARGTRIDVLLNGAVDPNVTFTAPTFTGSVTQCAAAGQAPGCTLEVSERTTATEMIRRFNIKTEAPTGPRGLRVTNTDGSVSECSNCFTVNGAALTSVNPNVVSNAPGATPTVTITFAGPNVPKSGTPSLQYVAENTGSATRADLTLTGRNVSFGPNSVTADYDVRNAAPGTNAYQPTLTQADGSTNACTCRFSVAQPQPPTVSTLDPNSVSQSDSRTVTIRGTNFSEGIQFRVSGSGVTVAAVQLVSETEARVNIQTTADAAPGKRDVTPVPTNGTPGPTCAGCLTVLASGQTAPPASASPSGSATPGPSGTNNGRYAGLASPQRVLDTRSNSGTRRSREIVLDLSGRVTDPNATAAVLNVTVTNATARGFLVAYPTGTTKPGTSNVNFEANQTQANEVVVRFGSNKRVSLFVDSASAHVIADLVGSFTTSTGADTGRVTTNAPVRAFDSRNTSDRQRRGEVIVDLTGRIPEGASDAVLNVTVTQTSARGFVTVFPTGTSRPGTSNVNFERSQTQANEVLTRVGTGSNAGKVSLFVDSADAALIVDVVGAVTPGTRAETQTFTALSSPTRALDTRNNSGTRRNGDVEVTMPSTVPSNATGVVLNVTATNGTRPGFVTVFPTGSTNPGTSNVNFPTNRTQANEVISRLGNNRRVTLFVGGANAPAAHLIVDVVGYLTAEGAPASTAGPTSTGSPRPTTSPSCTPGLLPTQSCPAASPSSTASPTGSPRPSTTASPTSAPSPTASPR